jgi:phosphatidylglycerol lysyltransferase
LGEGYHDQIVAFANILQSRQGSELSVDLMRQRMDIPNGLMDFLFTRLMSWGKTEGYRWFNLGMAPLSGLQTHPFAPVWNRVGCFVFRHGAHFYDFEGLRRYKAKFAPQWIPKYVAVAGRLTLARALLDIACLASGGAKNICRR